MNRIDRKKKRFVDEICGKQQHESAFKRMKNPKSMLNFNVAPIDH